MQIIPMMEKLGEQQLLKMLLLLQEEKAESPDINLQHPLPVELPVAPVEERAEIADRTVRPEFWELAEKEVQVIGTSVAEEVQ